MYTKAPWRANWACSEDGFVKEIERRDVDGFLIYSDSAIKTVAQTCQMDTEEETLANAHLISAAPEMAEWMEALISSEENITEYLEDRGWKHNVETGNWIKGTAPLAYDMLDAMYEEGEAILKKARGES